MARHLITSAIPYINGIKHLGNLVGSQLPADLYARYLRGREHEVMFICATDEHGTPAELAAAAAEAARLANHHPGSRSLDGVGHAAVSASYAVANALAGRALQAAEYAAYAAVYGAGGYGAVQQRESFQPELDWQLATLRRLVSPG